MSTLTPGGGTRLGMSGDEELDCDILARVHEMFGVNRTVISSDLRESFRPSTKENERSPVRDDLLVEEESRDEKSCHFT